VIIKTVQSWGNSEALGDECQEELGKAISCKGKPQRALWQNTTTPYMGLLREGRLSVGSIPALRPTPHDRDLVIRRPEYL
jgi:hypothetical protein